MSKFKVRCTKSRGNRFIKGKVYEVTSNGQIFDERGDGGNYNTTSSFKAWSQSCHWTDYAFELVSADRHELHITSDGTTTSAVYKLNGKVTKAAKAVCCPSDTYDFNTGTELAINRVLYGTDYNPREVAFKEPMQNEPKYAVGQRVIATDNVYRFVKQPATILHIDTSDYNTPFKVKFDDRGLVMWCRRGGIEPYAEPSLTVTRDMLVKLNACSAGLAEFDKKFPSGSGEFEAVYAATNIANRVWLGNNRSRIEAMQNQPKEAVTLYCVKDYKELSCDTIFTRGKLYEVDENGQIKTDTGFTTYRKWGSAEMKREFPVMSACLIRAEKRPAKKGEWVLITHAIEFNGRYKNGDIFKVTRKWENGIDVGEKFDMFDDEYLVLPDYKPEKVEPTYFSGKVVCVDVGETSKWWTKGKVYTYKDGYTTADNGEISPCETPAITNIEEFENYGSVKFIEYRGEQSC